MISLSIKDCELRLTAEVNMPYSGTVMRYFFAHKEDRDDLTELLFVEMQKQLASAIQSARQTAYLQGYADGRAKRKKETFFSCRL